MATSNTSQIRMDKNPMSNSNGKSEMVDGVRLTAHGFKRLVAKLK
ncbi:MAG: hypothetical protein ACJAYJ_003252 [Saprospiraceae bacterium]|jgi:hypothetical protein